MVAVLSSRQDPSHHEDLGPASAQQKHSTFVGIETCRECHAENADSHLRTPHATTFATTDESATAVGICNTTADGGSARGHYVYECDAQGLTVSLPERFPDRSFPLDFALGSGSHAITFLTLLQEPAGETVGIEHRMTWYRSDGRLDVTPGHDGLLLGESVEYFGRVFRGEDLKRCIGCHTTTASIVGDRLSDLRPGVQCEACHGPGKEHVRAARDAREEAPSLIRARWIAADEVALCGRCHRLPEDIAPERLAAYPKSLVRFQPVGLLQSRCYQASAGTLKCTTCHDPHSGVDSRSAEQQVATCLECHRGPQQTRCRVSPTADCIRCHMPSMELVRGISFHDHWIRVRTESADAVGSGAADVDHAAPDRPRALP